MRSVRTVVRTLLAGFLALAGAVLAAPAVLAHAQEAHQQSSRTDGASSRQLTISIDAVNPANFATPSSTITVSGTITNLTGSPIRGAQVQLLTEAQYFYTRADMDSFAAGSNPYYIVPQNAGNPYVMTGTLHSGATARWSASFSAAAIGYSVFGVYPLAAQAEYPDGTPSGSERTFLPFWPGKGGTLPQPLSTAWVWPLIDQPQQGPCSQTVATNSLAASLGTGGRLGTLLAVGRLWAQEDHLTWAVDPALLSDATVMRHPYKVDEDSACTGRKPTPASAAAAAWLSSLRADTAGEPMFVTPYGDTDVAALAHSGLDADLRTAFRLGESQARQILSRPFGIHGQGTGDGGSPAVAWPADGAADASVLDSLAGDGGINTVVLNSGEMRSTAAPYDNALAKTTTSNGTSMRVLLADSQLTSILGSASAASSAGAQFAAEQDFLAQTAMIVAEAPSLKRSLVIAPPPRWDPSASEAAKLLSMTYSAPWLTKVDLSSLATAAGNLKSHGSLPLSKPGPAELGELYLDQVQSVDSSLAVYEDLLYRPDAALLRTLNAAAVATESSAWRGAGAAGGTTALLKLADYLKYCEGQVQILTGTKLLLAGASGPAPVSVQNTGKLAVQVGITVSVPPNSPLTVDNLDKLITILPGKTVTLKMTVHSAAIGTSQMQLQLVTEDGSPLGTSHPLSVQATRYGRALLVLIGAALGVLVLTSMARWIRRRNDGRADGRSGGTG
jgi:hypothetical protein